MKQQHNRATDDHRLLATELGDETRLASSVLSRSLFVSLVSPLPSARFVLVLVVPHSSISMKHETFRRGGTRRICI